jgi:hypothetical protein
LDIDATPQRFTAPSYPPHWVGCMGEQFLNLMGKLGT